MVRKTPVKHRVKFHTRDGHPVHGYTRGHGSPRYTLKKRITHLTSTKPKPYTVNFTYSEKKGDGETVVVISTSYHKALLEAFEERKDKREPIALEVIDPDLGKVLGAIGHGLNRVAHIGGKYAVKGAKITGKWAAQQLAEKYNSSMLKRLVNECYSTDRTTRILARARLKREFPDVYALCDFSRRK